MTAAEILALLRAHPDAAIEAIGQLRVAAPWVSEERGSGETWVRYPRFDGTQIAHGQCPLYSEAWDREALGDVLPPEESERGWEAWADEERISTFGTLEPARVEVDAVLERAGWVTP